jgi:hypothetical protein
LCNNGPEGWQDWRGWWSDAWAEAVDINESRVRNSECEIDDTQVREYDPAEVENAYQLCVEMKAEIEEYLRQ